MLNTLITIAAFLFALGLLVTVHEFGHYWVMRRVGVKVLKFSVGFGRALFSWRAGRDRTEYAIAVLPLGGYVKPLDEREGEVPEADLPRAHNRQSLPKRAAIAAAGPAFNLLFAVLAYWVVFISGVPGLKPVVGPVAPHSAAAEAGFQRGDEIVAVDGSATPTWQAAVLSLLEEVMNGGSVAVEVKQRDGASRTLRLQIKDSERLTQPGGLLPGLGLSPWQPPAVIGSVVEGSPAAAAGFQVGDEVVASGGEPIDSWGQWVTFIQKHPGEIVPMVVLRNGTRQTLDVHIGATSRDGRRIGHVGAAVQVPEGVHDRMVTVQQYAPLAALGHAFSQTGEVSWLTLRMFWGMASGQASLKNLSGPIGIAQYAGNAASGGVITFATFLAVISISLGILNLLPIPVLDGGHLLFYAIEWIKGGPLSSRAELVGQQIGLTLLLVLIGFTVFNDLTRLAG
ncbi:MAG TPA: RIP metalloprotease RseP [Gammaproteobacteria bacterium]|nr:RIP metalloprotease RseP [Gammaproteobacteria bacterium]